MNSETNKQLPARTNVVNYPNGVYPEELLEQSSGLDLREFINILMRRKKLVLGTALATFLTALVLTLLMQAVYRADATLKVERYAPNSSELLDTKVSRSDRDFFETQIQLLQSRTLARRVIDQLGLETRIEPTGLFAKIKGLFLGNSDAGQDNPSNTETLFLENLTVKPINNSQLLKVSYDSTDPKLAADITNTIVKTFVRQNLERRFDTASSSKAYLSDSMKMTKKSLEEAEKRLNDYAKAHNIIQDTDGQSAITYALKKQAEELIAAEKNRIEAEAAYKLYLNSPDKNKSSVNLLNDPYILSLKKAAARLETQYQSLKNKRTNRARQLRKQIDRIRKQVSGESINIQNALKSNYLASKQTEEMLSGQYNKLKQKALEMQSKNTRYNALRREVEINQLAYNKQLEELMALNSVGTNGSNNITIIDSAGIPDKKYKPSMRTNLAFGLLLGLLLGMGVAFLREFVDDSIKTSDSLETLTGLPVLSQLPEIEKLNAKQLALLTAVEPQSSLSEAIRSLRTSLRFSTRNGAPQSVFITSTGPAEGKSTVAINLAAAYSQAGSRVLLIDADLRNPSIHNLLGLENLRGLTNLLAGTETDQDISRSCMIKNLRVITSGPIPPDPVELLSGDKMVELIKDVTKQYDHIIIDGPPVLGLADALILANLAEATIVAVQAGKTSKTALLDSLKRLERAKANIVGSILTRVSRALNPDYDQGYYSYHASARTAQAADKPRLRSL
jgi:capsular exopolysaccharide synthesis family protein